MVGFLVLVILMDRWDGMGWVELSWRAVENNKTYIEGPGKVHHECNVRVIFHMLIRCGGWGRRISCEWKRCFGMMQRTMGVLDCLDM